ncbi:uncharacterized protein EI90DRAFT_3116538 [Cantharellus anzutake]|uniref:uncharacterized protein n=1 Tax=Cantharellus anzutake TaxID=1750568 RepID=UPI0019066964|nr:uncharacterized protein EI90DRAFT_3116538 [Cantharellus anzutake]KAF8341398.1 hypothetical protein EI90DRAFT_3116538 [Cantharellus anzutake]
MSNSSSNSYSSLSTHLTQPSDSPSLDFGPGGNILKAINTPSRNTAIRRARHESSNPYPPRSSSFSGSESVRSSSSETEDNVGMYSFAPTQGALPHAAAPSDYSNLFARQNTAAPSSLEASPGVNAFQRMTIAPEQQDLEQLAVNVRAATTTSASDRAKHIFVQAWLNANYAPYQDGNVPRQGLYHSYRAVCDEYRIPHVNTATLGKAIRLCFPAIKTRRLGVRGNSKYHYCGIRPATAAEAEWLQDFIKRSNNIRPQQNSRPSSQHSGRSSATEDSPEDDDEDGDESGTNSSTPASRLAPVTRSISNGGRKSPIFFNSLDDKTPTVSGNFSVAQSTLPNHVSSNYRGEAQIRRRSPQGLPGALGPGSVVSSNVPPHMRNGPVASQAGVVPPPTFNSNRPMQSVRMLPNFPNIEEAIGQPSSSPQGVAARDLWTWFEAHLDSLLEAVRSFRFDRFDMLWRTFWSGLSSEHREIAHAPAVAGLMARADAIVYDEILEILRSQILTQIPPPTLTSLRSLAERLERSMLAALEGYGNTFVEPKVELCARFGHLLVRFLDIYQVTQALSSVMSMSNPRQLIDMARAWREIDFESIRNQAALVCNCRHEDLQQLLEVDFAQVLDGLQSSLDPVKDIMTWADSCCERLLNGSGGILGEERATMSSRSLLIRWGYVTSQIMRDLTIRSDPAFGAFQILKLFMDDWIGLSVLRTVALSTNSVAQSVDPLLQQQFLTLSPANTGFTGGLDNSATNGGQHVAHNGLGGPHGNLLASAMHDPFGPSPSSSYPYDSLGFGHMDTTGSGPGGASGLAGFGDFTNGTTAGAGAHYATFAPPEDMSTAIPEENIPREITPIVDTDMPPSDGGVPSSKNSVDNSAGGEITQVKTETV